MSIFTPYFQRWFTARCNYIAEYEEQEGFTYRAVLQNSGVFGDAAGDIRTDKTALGLLLKALSGEYATTEYVNEFITLALCDLAINIVDLSFYEGVCKALEQQNAFLGQASNGRKRLQKALRKNNIFRITTGASDQRLYVLSLCSFVPAYRMTKERLTQLIVSFVQDRWRTGGGLGASLRTRQSLEEAVEAYLGDNFTAAGKVNDMKKPFTEMIREVLSLVELAMQSSDFDQASPEEFAQACLQIRGVPPLAGQPVTLHDLWGRLRAWSGASDAVHRIGISRLQQLAATGELRAMPDGTEPPAGLGGWPDHDVPWGKYEGRNGTPLLVIRDRLAGKASETLFTTLLSLPLEAPSQVRLIERDGEAWLITDWPFRVQNGGSSSPLWGRVEDQPVRRHVCRLRAREQYHLTGWGNERECLHEPVTLDGSGQPARPRPQCRWMLEEGREGLKPRLAVYAPPGMGRTSLEVSGGGKFNLEPGDSLLLTVPPQGELKFTGTTEMVRMAVRLEPPLLFLPSHKAGQWRAYAPGDPIPLLGEQAYLLGPQQETWPQCQGVELTACPEALGPGWQGFGLWEVRRTRGIRALQIGSRGRIYWQSERMACLSWSVQGATGRDDELLIFDDPEKTKITIRGRLGRAAGAEIYLCADENRPEGRKSTPIPITSQAEVHEEISMSRILEALGPQDHAIRRLTLYLQGPATILKPEPNLLHFSSRPGVQAWQEGVLQPGEQHCRLRLESTEAELAALEVYDPQEARWIQAEANGAGPTIRISLPPAMMKGGWNERLEPRLEMPLRIGGFIFNPGVSCELRATGLGVQQGSQWRLLREGTAECGCAWSQGALLQAVKLEPGEWISLVPAHHPDAEPVLRLEAASPAYPVKALPCTFRTNLLLARLHRPNETVALGRLRVTRQEAIDAVEVTEAQGQLRVHVQGFIPQGESIEVVVADHTGNEVEEAELVSERGAIDAELIFEPPVADFEDCSIILRSSSGTELKQVLVRLAKGARAPQTEQELLRQAISLCKDGTARQQAEAACFVAGPLHQALWAWAAAAEEHALPADELKLLRNRYIRLLLECHSQEAWRAITARELLRIVQGIAGADERQIQTDRRDTELLRALLGWFQQQFINSRVMGRLALSVGLVGVTAQKPEDAWNEALQEQAWNLLFDWNALAEFDPRLDQPIGLSAKEFLERLGQNMEGKTAAQWRKLSEFLGRKLSLDGVSLGESLKRSLIHPEQANLATARLALITHTMPAVRQHFNACELYWIAWKVLHAEEPDSTGFLTATPVGGDRTLGEAARELLEKHRLDAVVAHGIVWAEGNNQEGQRAITEKLLAELAPEEQRKVLCRLLDRSTTRGHTGSRLTSCISHIVDLFLPKEGPCELSSWIEFMADYINQGPMNSGWLELLKILGRQQFITDPLVLSQSLPRLVAQLQARKMMESVRAGLARLLARMVAPVDPVALQLPEAFHPVADAIIQLMVNEEVMMADHPDMDWVFANCINYYTPEYREAQAATLNEDLPALGMLVAALKVRLERNMDKKVFDLAGSAMKRLARIRYSLAKQGDIREAERAIRIYLHVVRFARWDPKENETWGKIWELFEIIPATEEELLAKLRLECAQCRCAQDFWRAGFWWLSLAASEAAQACSAERAAQVAGQVMTRWPELQPLAEAVQEQIIRGIEEERELNENARKHLIAVRKCDIMLSTYPKVFDSETSMKNLKMALKRGLADEDIEEQYADLVMQPGVPPNLAGKLPPGLDSLLRLLAEGTRGAQRKRIIHWLIKGSQAIAELAHNPFIMNKLGGDFKYEVTAQAED